MPEAPGTSASSIHDELVAALVGHREIVDNFASAAFIFHDWNSYLAPRMAEANFLRLVLDLEEDFLIVCDVRSMMHLDDFLDALTKQLEDLGPTEGE